MNKTPDTNATPVRAAHPETATALFLKWLTVALTVALVFLVAFSGLSPQKRRDGDKGADAAIASSLIERVEQVEKRLAALESSPAVKGAERQDDAAALSALKGDLASLSAALDTLRVRAEEKERSLDQDWRTVRADLETLVLFAGLEREASRGAPFGAQHRAMVAACALNAPASEVLAVLAPFAATGHPSAGSLVRQWHEGVAARAGAAWMKAQARSWHERILAGLDSLVSIRSLARPTPMGRAIDDVATALDSGRLQDALEKARAWPDPARESVRDWIDALDSRLKIEGALAVLGERLAEKGKTPPASQGEGNSP